MPDKPIVLQFRCPFCPPIREAGVIELDSGDGSISHTLPTCPRFDAISMDESGSMADFVADCRKRYARSAPS